MKKHGELMKELDLVFLISGLYVKHRNNKHETYATAFIDIHSAKNTFFPTGFFEPQKNSFLKGRVNFVNQRKTVFREDLSLRIRKWKFFLQRFNFANEGSIRKNHKTFSL